MKSLEIYVKAKKHETSGRGYAFFKLMNFYKNDSTYEKMFGSTPLNFVG